MENEADARRLALEALRHAPPPALFRSPIDYIFADHFRQRTLCKLLDDIAREPEWDREKISAALDFLRTDFGTHVLDEEEGLFPLLRRRAEPEDCIEDVLHQLSEDHGEDEEDARTIAEGFAEIVAGSESHCESESFRELLRQFAANEKRHLTLENAIVLPLARARLTEQDLHDLGTHMAARRGLDLPEATTDAV